MHSPPILEHRSVVVSKDGVAVHGTPRVEVLIERVLYVAVDGFDPVQSGNVLVRNLELGRALAAKQKEVRGKDTFVVYRNIYDALRGLRAIPRQYDRVEVGRIQSWQKTLRWMLEASWQLKDVSSDTVKVYQDVGADTVAKESSVRDPNKVTARERMRKATSITDSRGRKNPGRIPPLLWSSSDLLAKRQGAVRDISHRVDARVYVLACYLDSLMRMRDRYEIMVAHLLGSGVLQGKCVTRRILSAMADRLRQSAVVLCNVHVGPFGAHWTRVVEHLHDAANDLKAQKSPLEGLLAAQRELYFMDARRELEEVVSTLASYRDRDVQPSQKEWEMFREKMKELWKWLENVGSRNLDKKNRILIYINEALECLRLVDPTVMTREEQFQTVYSYMKDACAACD